MATSPPTDIKLRSPSRYSSAPEPSTSATPAPALEWLHRTWTVTHSTLSMWRDARNVRITYKPLDPKPDGTPRIDDLVEYEPIKASTGESKGKLKSVHGADTAASAADPTTWDWRGAGWLFWVTSHWELLGWGERPLQGEGEGEGVERWAVTWFAPTPFTKEGIDIYCDRKEGLSEETYRSVMEALEGMGVDRIKDMSAQDMKPVVIQLPWQEK